MATALDKFSSDIAGILEQYGQKVGEETAAAVEAVAKSGAKALKSSAKSTFGGSGEYASGWTSKSWKGRFESGAVIYNKKAPQLAHLLEFGHAKRNGGRVAGRPHIEPVEAQIIKEFEQKLRSDL